MKKTSKNLRVADIPDGIQSTTLQNVRRVIAWPKLHRLILMSSNWMQDKSRAVLLSHLSWNKLYPWRWDCVGIERLRDMVLRQSGKLLSLAASSCSLKRTEGKWSGRWMHSRVRSTNDRSAAVRKKWQRKKGFWAWACLFTVGFSLWH
jgi:hypothetical protein